MNETVDFVTTVAKSGGNTKSLATGLVGAGVVVVGLAGYHLGKKWWNDRQLTRLQQAAARASA